MKKISKPKNMPPRPVPALLLLDQPNAIMVLVNGWGHIIYESKCLYANPKTIDAMIDAGWITSSPRAIEGSILVYDITIEGRASALHIRENQIGYHQLALQELTA